MSAKTLVRTLAGIAALLAPTASQAQASPAIRDRAGCYALSLGSWSTPLSPGLVSTQTPPTHFRLDTTIVMTKPSSRYAVEPAHVSPGSMIASWTMLPNDSMSIFWSTGFVGVTLSVAIHGDSLVGSATTFHDAHYPTEPPDPRASVLAVKEACPPR